MKNKDWQQIESFFHSALGVEVEERDAYLSEVCAGNKLLRREVETLIEAFENRSTFLDESAFELGLTVLESDSKTSLAGQTVGNYKIQLKIGEGGMGDVYLASDTRLNRRVALKLLSPALVGDKWAKRQLVKEAQAAAMLEHPNICAVHSFEEIGEHSFIVMQYIEGRTLADLLEQRLVRPEMVWPLAQQITGALAAAHAHGIIHRDVKSGNIMVTAEGNAKVLDFGLAKISTARSTETTGESLNPFSQSDVIVGTVAYMSPEQLRAEKLDFQSDIFSLGIVLYQLISGKHPFLRKSDAETISAILKDAPAPLNGLVGKIPVGLNRIVKKCLEKNKEQRYQSASEVLLDFFNLPEKKKLSQKNRYLRWLIISIVLVCLITVGALIYRRANKVQTLAVLPFINESADLGADYLTDGMAESLIYKLSLSPQVSVKAFTQVSGFGNNRKDPAEIGKALHVEMVLTDSIIRQNDQLVLQTKLIKTADGTIVWSNNHAWREAEILIIQDSIAQNVLTELRVVPDNKISKNREGRFSENADAYRYYLKGRSYWGKRDGENIKMAIEAFNKAIEIDPAYAKAYSGLADVYVVRSLVTYNPIPSKDAMIRAKAAAKQALEIDDSLCESHTAMGVVLQKYEWNWPGAEREFLRAIELNPEYAQAHYWYSDLLATTGRLDQAIFESLKARELDPFSPLAEMNVGRVFYYARQYDNSLQYLSHTLENDPHNSKAIYITGLIYLQQKRYDEALAVLVKLYNSKDKPLAIAALGYAYGKSGRKVEAQAILNELEEMAKSGYVPPQERAIVYLGLNDKEKAVYWLEQSYGEHLPALAAVNVEPLFDDLRADAGFQNLIQRMNF